jgi:NifU-like protein involved in Fe-S cluster formation
MTPDPRYSAEVVRRLRELPGAGDLEHARPGMFAGRADAADDGARVLLALRAASGAIVEARFRAYGCPYFIAAASWFTERVIGLAQAELAAWDWREAATALEIPPARFGRLITLQDAVRAAAAAWPEDAIAGV